jgi:hypothetical protein
MMNDNHLPVTVKRILSHDCHELGEYFVQQRIDMLKRQVVIDKLLATGVILGSTMPAAKGLGNNGFGKRYDRSSGKWA